MALFSGIINLLGFTGPLFMLEVYDRVIPSGSLPTLVALLILAAGLYAFSGFLDIVRMRVLSRTAGIVDASLSKRVLAAVAGASLKTRVTGDVLKPAQEMDQIRAFLGGAGPAALFDLPWMPVYLAVCFFLHPLIGWLAAAAMLILVGLTIATDVLTRSRTREAAAAIATRNRFGEAAHRNAEAIAAMGMLGEVQSRWVAAHAGLTTLQRRTGDVVAMLTGASNCPRGYVNFLDQRPYPPGRRRKRPLCRRQPSGIDRRSRRRR
ncbi:ABC transporter transmembrane domain-containing protein [Neorhizobium galegae]|uniref:ABC transporter transmembrane domain-containing protein n=1 Tax=Neorhizobium galegae TaxID=399 RepID=UPI001AEC4733|nr:ABC transporter transmembrane domain-containing protein [Neorhizobium galegae]